MIRTDEAEGIANRLRIAGYPAKMILIYEDRVVVHLDWKRIKSNLHPRTVKMKVRNILNMQEIRVI